MSKYNDIKYGLSMEGNLLNKFNEFFDTELSKYNDKYSTFDFHNEDDNIIVELKSRKENSNHYYFKNDIMIGENKVREGVELVVLHNKNVYLCFSFKDGVVLYYKVNENSLEECNIRMGGRCDRGWDERKNTCFVPRGLCKVME